MRISDQFWSRRNKRDYSSLDVRNFFHLSNCTREILESKGVPSVELSTNGFQREEKKVAEFRKMVSARAKLMKKRHGTFLIILRGIAPHERFLNVYRKPKDVTSWLRRRLNFHKARDDQPWTVSVHIRRGDAQDFRFHDINFYLEMTTRLVLWSSVGTRIHIYTELGFTDEEERNVLELHPHATIFRGDDTTLLSDIKRMAASDVLITSKSSLLSQFVAHICDMKTIKIVHKTDRNRYKALSSVMYHDDLEQKTFIEMQERSLASKNSIQPTLGFKSEL